MTLLDEATTSADDGESAATQQFTPEIPLPATLAELPPRTHLSLNKRVWDVIFGSGQLFNDPVFNAYLRATKDEDAVTGSVEGDNWMAAGMIHEAGGFSETVYDIKHALRPALAFEKLSRGQRAPKAIEA